MCPERHGIRLGTQFKCDPSSTTSLKNCILYTYGAGSLPAKLLEKLLAPWKKSYDQPRQNNKKQRYYFADKGPSIQSYGFPVVMYGCETIKNAEHQRIDAFELWH